MIYIKKNKINKITLTLSESSRLTNPNYLFVLKNEFIQNPTIINWMATDESNYTNRYNLFQLEESVLGSTTGGINLPLNLVAGQYKYTIYESEIETLDIELTTKRIVETGRMIVAEERLEKITNNPNNIYN